MLEQMRELLLEERYEQRGYSSWSGVRVREQGSKRPLFSGCSNVLRPRRADTESDRGGDRRRTIRSPAQPQEGATSRKIWTGRKDTRQGKGRYPRVHGDGPVQGRGKWPSNPLG